MRVDIGEQDGENEIVFDSIKDVFSLWSHSKIIFIYFRSDFVVHFINKYSKYNSHKYNKV